MNFKVVIIDDEPKAIDLLRHHIDQVDILTIKKTFRNPFKAYHYLSTVEVDLIFLDINMPQLSGLDLLRNLKKKPSVIFTTAYSKYAIDGFELDAIDYLLKPINFSRFLRSVQKFIDFKKGAETVNYIPSDPVYIKSGTSSRKLMWTDILCLEKDENYVVYRLKNGQRLLSRSTLTETEKTFPSYVIRVHKSFAVCLYNVSMMETNRIFVEDLEIPIGRKFKEVTHLKYNEHILLSVNFH